MQPDRSLSKHTARCGISALNELLRPWEVAVTPLVKGTNNVDIGLYKTSHAILFAFSEVLSLGGRFEMDLKYLHRMG
jgi:hypothetical protein